MHPRSTSCVVFRDDRNVGLTWLIALGLACISATIKADDSVGFNRVIRPLLSEKCLACHGPGAKQDEGQIRLDQRDELIKPNGEGQAILVPGHPDQSELIRRILSDDESIRMPPASSKKSLTNEEKELLVRWVRDGAQFESHWAFVPPKRSKSADVRPSNWPKSEIDRFVLDRLAREKLEPSPEADKRTLLRRLSLDLIGLPPTISEIDAFLADGSPDAYAKQVDRLLSSAHYGERWGRIWLDAARYADSDGYEKDKPRLVSVYRDWVIQSLNEDLPYDDFVIDQIAGDLRPNATQDQKVATGFLRNSMINEEGGVDPEQFRMEAMFDRMDAIGKSVLGLTIQCTQCHDHKFDPLTQEEYYRMFAFLNSSYEGSMAAYTPAQLQRKADLLREIEYLQSRYKEINPDWPQKVNEWEQSVRARQVPWTIVQTAEDDPSGGQKMYRMKDGSFLCQGYSPAKHSVSIQVTVTLPTIGAIRLEQLNDPNLPFGGPGRSIQGTSALTEFKVRAWPIGKPESATAVKFKQAVASVSSPEKPLPVLYFDKTDKKRTLGPASFAIDGDDTTAWGIDIDPGRRNKPCEAVFVTETPIANPDGTVLEIQLIQNHGGWNNNDNQSHNLGRFRLAVSSSSETLDDLIGPDIRSILDIPVEQRTAEQSSAVFSAWLGRTPETASLAAQIDALWSQHPEPTSQLVLNERSDPRMTSVLNRGDFLKPSKEVSPGVPSFLHPLSSASAVPNRLDFARWLVDRKSPTAARSLVNRIWQAYFGEGLVSTTDDFGMQGAPPTHPELLDWLSVEFMEQGWSLKRLHRLIVQSATYRQSSRISPELAVRDPHNHFLARGARFRVDAETVRDLALAVSGLLEEKLGGPSVHPPAPEFLFLPPVSYGTKVWNEDRGPDRYRRALYTFRFRSVPYPVFQTFDAPNADVSCVRRPRSNTPLQALITLNESLFLECARAMARELVQSKAPDDRQRLVGAYRRCIGRDPNEREIRLVLGLLDRQRQRFTAGDLNPLELAADDPQHSTTLPDGVSAPDLAAWTAVCRVLLNLDETITRE